MNQAHFVRRQLRFDCSPEQTSDDQSEQTSRKATSIHQTLDVWVSLISIHESDFVPPEIFYLSDNF
jgi:hypothetical protein